MSLPESELSEFSPIKAKKVSESEPSFTEQVAKNNEQDFQYKQLDKYTDNLAFTSDNQAESNSETSEIQSEVPEMDMTNEDAEIMASFGVSTINSSLPMLFKAPVSMSDVQQEQLATKAAPLVKKYYSGDNVPEWLKKYQDEIGFGMALSVALFGCWQQSKQYKLEQQKQAQADSEQSEQVA